MVYLVKEERSRIKYSNRKMKKTSKILNLIGVVSLLISVLVLKDLPFIIGGVSLVLGLAMQVYLEFKN